MVILLDPDDLAAVNAARDVLGLSQQEFGRRALLHAAGMVNAGRTPSHLRG